MNTECTDCAGEGFTSYRRCETCGGFGIVELIRYCAGCGEREGSDYAKHCCTDDNMLEA